VRNSQRRERTDLNSTIAASNQKIGELKKQKAELNLGQRKLETEVGPIKYVAQLVYGADDTNTIDKAVRLLVLLLIFVFDPLAILMVIAANISAKKDAISINIPPTNNFAETVNNKANTTKMDTEWNPGSWFKMVKKPK
jgi:hypothetical protein